MSNKHKRNHRHLQQPGAPANLPKPKQDNFDTVTTCTFDFWDRVRILFGARVQVTIRARVLLDGPKIIGVNSTSEALVTSNSTHTFGQDRPTFGYTEVPSSSSKVPTRKQVIKMSEQQKKQDIPSPEEATQMVNEHLKKEGAHMEVDKVERIGQ